MVLIYTFVGQITLFKHYFHVFIYCINNALFYVIYYKNSRYSHQWIYINAIIKLLPNHLAACICFISNLLLLNCMLVSYVAVDNDFDNYVVDGVDFYLHIVVSGEMQLVLLTNVQ